MASPALLSLLLLTSAPAQATQTLVPGWVLERLETQARTAPTADALLDLAELWSRIAEDEAQKALAAHVAAHDACFRALRTDCDTLTVEDAAARAAWSHAAARYRQLLRDFPDDPRLEQAVYGLGWAWQQRGEDALAAAAFAWVGAAAPPDSVRRQHALLLAGEHAFETWEIDQAVLAFQAAADAGGMLAPWALRRLGWAYYRQGELGMAIDTMKQAALTTDDPRAAVQEEALRDLLRFYQDAGELNLFPECHGSSTCRPLLLRLAQTHAERGQTDRAVQIWRRLIAEGPNHTDVPDLYAHIIEALLLDGSIPEALAEVTRAEQTLPPPYPEALQHAREHTLREGGQAHQEAGQREAALVLYDRYLQGGFPDYAYEVTFWRAQVLEGLGRTAEAAAIYRHLAATQPRARYARLAAEGARRLETLPD